MSGRRPGFAISTLHLLAQQLLFSSSADNIATPATLFGPACVAFRMLNESSDAFLDKDAAKDADGWRLDLGLLRVSKLLGQVGVADMKSTAVEAFVGNDQVPGASGRARGFSLGDGHGGISGFDVAPGFGGILPDSLDR